MGRGKPNKNAYKALIAAEYSGVEVRLVENFEMGISNKTPEFLKMNPLGKVPVLETPEGPVFESNAIAHLASNTFLVGHIVTLADVIMTCNLYLGFSEIMTKSFTSEFPYVERYLWTMVNQPNVKKFLGEVKQAVSVPTVPSKKPAVQPKETKPKAKDEPKKEAEKEVEKQPAKAEAAGEILGHYAFGKMLVSGAEPPFKVKGVWLFRGQEIPQFVIDECYDMELYEWKKVDI
ncbi:Elongation factor 1-gamma 3 [Hibiscus syriacus]|uniref:Elongation factor 1-gamma 3 n=1 Tax=Hibiscus syriacus TaxID=106335 RepID=A0A6A2X722_HIBSY|nr:Elongation factor 1-gamma 3 [Hibiscus syriacus]